MINLLILLFKIGCRFILIDDSINKIYEIWVDINFNEYINVSLYVF